MYKIIRCGSGFDPVIVVSPPDAGPDTPNAKYYRCASWQIGNHQPEIFNEISKDEAVGYFSGQADGMGFEVPPAENFPSLKSAQHYIREKRNEWSRNQLEQLKDLGIETIEDE